MGELTVTRAVPSNEKKEAAVPAGYRRDLVPMRAPSSALVVWRPRADR